MLMEWSSVLLINVDTRTYSVGEQSNPAGAFDQGGMGFELFLGKPCRGGALERPIPLLKPSPCRHNVKEVDDWKGLNEWNSWLKSYVRDSNRSQDIVNLSKKKSLKQLKTVEEIAL
ncbi:hypothetical protein TNCV_683651 [Trichonephila clavipes]|nr:hypothetical protein TNCV_683651 [Trichonephila clavipes]